MSKPALYYILSIICLIMSIVFFWLGVTFADPPYYEDDLDGYNAEARAWEKARIPLPNVHPRLWPLRPNVYGPGIGSDATGRPFMWTPGYGLPDPLPQVQPRTYGPTMGVDQYGRPVVPTCPYGIVC